MRRSFRERICFAIPIPRVAPWAGMHRPVGAVFYVLDTETIPANVGDATIAYYFLCGIKHGLFQTDCAKEWAFDVIAARDAPPIEIIEVAIAKTRYTVFCNLGLVCCGADNQLAGRWLLGTLVLNDNEA